MTTPPIFLIAGGTGFIGKALAARLSSMGEVRILSRSKTDGKHFFRWNPDLKQIDPQALIGVTHLINLSGEGIADKRWTATRKETLIRSRVQPALFLRELSNQMPDLKHYISASGVNCYDTTNETHLYKEEEAFTGDFVSQVVAHWEEAANHFLEICPVLKLRIGFVLAQHGGSLPRLTKPIKMGFGCVLGKGTQGIPWIHLEDLVSLIEYGIKERLEGAYNCCAGNTTNAELTHVAARILRKKIWMPAAPAFALRLLLGEMSDLVLKGIKADNQKLLRTGFQFRYPDLEEALRV